jgi:hypothetical protein
MRCDMDRGLKGWEEVYYMQSLTQTHNSAVGPTFADAKSR